MSNIIEILDAYILEAETAIDEFMDHAIVPSELLLKLRDVCYEVYHHKTQDGVTGLRRDGDNWVINEGDKCSLINGDVIMFIEHAPNLGGSWFMHVNANQNGDEILIEDWSDLIPLSGIKVND